ncbi:hypothetical protein [Anaerolentibacter hominis]|uniref:hypothetical protein n=1 Tax=Anaerolentibacter hominis TaxID=3079009 RepID=UPI0031B848E8
MRIFQNNDNISYTKIEVILSLEECPSDWENNFYFIDVAVDAFSQQDCYIREQKVEEIHIRRVENYSKEEMKAPQWRVELIVTEFKTEEQTIQIVEDLCEILSANCAMEDSFYQQRGMYGFSYQSMDIKRSYAGPEMIFNEVDINGYGSIEMTCISTIKENIFKLPDIPIVQSTLSQRLKKAFLAGIKSKDVVSRYILLYYLFEIMFDTPEYQALKMTYSSSKKRDVILYEYLTQKFGELKYTVRGQEFVLDADILSRIIKARNDLTHRADLSNVHELMYGHLIPVLQVIIKKCEYAKTKA